MITVILIQSAVFNRLCFFIPPIEPNASKNLYLLTTKIIAALVCLEFITVTILNTRCIPLT